MKKLFAVLLSVIIILSLASCSGKSENIAPSEKKVAIVISTNEICFEENLASDKLVEEYPNNIIIRRISDTRVKHTGIPEIVTVSKELAKDNSIGAIIYPRASVNAADAIKEAKAINPSLKFLCTEPECSIEYLSSISDQIICVNWKKAAEDIVEKAKEHGANCFVMFSTEKHIVENPLYSSEKYYFEEACKKNKIDFCFELARDTDKEGGIAKSQQYIKEAIGRLILNNKIPQEDVALFSTETAIQKTLIDSANKRGFIYVSSSVPSAYGGLNEIYNISASTEISDIVNQIKISVREDKNILGKHAVYNYPLATQMLRSSVFIAFDMLNGKTNRDNIAERAIMRIKNEATDKRFSVERHPDDNLKNIFVVYCSAFENIIKE